MPEDQLPDPGAAGLPSGPPGRSGSSALGAGAARQRRRRGLRIVALVAAILVLVGAGGAGYLYHRLNANIKSVDIDSALGGDRPAKLGNGAMDILVLGSDSRSGANREYGHDSGSARSDTAMIVHLGRGHRSASVVSIPRDTLVARPSCRRPGGGTVPAVRRAMFNTAYQTGGPVCAVKTVEKLTGLRMDHYIEVDFTGFKDLVDVLGGVPLTTTKAIRDPKSHLSLPAGTHTLDGEQALGLVRTRHTVADGSDLGRIQLQQAFIRALLDRVGGLGLLSSPTELVSVADTATRALTTDTGLGSVSRLTGLADSIRHLGPGRLQMVTLPVRYAAGDPNRVQPIGSGAAQVWAALRADRPVPAAATKGSVAAEAGAGKVVGAAPAATPPAHPSAT